MKRDELAELIKDLAYAQDAGAKELSGKSETESNPDRPGPALRGILDRAKASGVRIATRGSVDANPRLVNQLTNRLLDKAAHMLAGDKE